MSTTATLSQLSQLILKEKESLQNGNSDPYHSLALQIKHNLEFQHRWTELRIHTTSPSTGKTLARPIISGLPPRRMYVHPDEQIEFIKQSKKEHGSNPSKKSDADDFKPESEWVFPAHLQEEWSLSDFAALFDLIDSLPPGSQYEDLSQEERDIAMRWRMTKRALFAILQDDSTIVYYFVHDGIVKPRQN